MRKIIDCKEEEDFVCVLFSKLKNSNSENKRCHVRGGGLLITVKKMFSFAVCSAN
jgi:hypothetical protein